MKFKIVWFFIDCLLAGLIVGLVSFWFVKIILIKKLKQVLAIASQIRDKNISQNIVLDSNDEVGEIVNGMNAAMQNIRHLFIEIINVFEVSETILLSVNANNKNHTSAIDKIAVVAAEIRKLASNSSESSQIIAQNIKLIQEDVNRAAKSVEEITNDVKRNNVDIESINKQFLNIDKTIRENLDSNIELNGSVYQLNGAFNEIQNAFSELKKYLNTLNSMVDEYKV